MQKILGHQSVQMTMRYAHLAPDAYKEAQRASRLSKQDLSVLISRGKRLAVTEATLGIILKELGLLEGTVPRAALAARQIAVTKSIPLSFATSGMLARLENQA